MAAVQHFRVNLEGRQFCVVADCAALRWLLQLKNPSSRLYWYALEFAAFNFEDRHRPERENIVADALPRHFPPEKLMMLNDSLPLNAERLAEHDKKIEADVTENVVRDGIRY